MASAFLTILLKSGKSGFYEFYFCLLELLTYAATLFFIRTSKF